MLSEKLVQKINNQIKYELYSAHLYYAMAAYCDSQDLPGFANFFKVQAEEERFHASKFYDFLNRMDARVLIYGLEEPKNDYSSVLDAFKASLDHEKSVTKRIYALTDIATEEKEHATISLLKWFIDEQVEEEDMFNGIIKKLQRIGNDSAALYMLDDELAQRTFTPPASPDTAAQ
ncbi:MAG: ferritin [Clostridiales bacterium]|jgi:ferritin|nr:ferritin [Clostridiales bacterium]MDK2934075.1 ferritin [Clostridiales bacterium]